MKIEHLEERVLDYKKSIETVVEKKTLWKTKTKDLFYNVENNTTETTQYQPPLRNNFMNSSLFINPEEKAQYEMARGLLDGNDDSLVNTNGTINFKLPFVYNTNNKSDYRLYNNNDIINGLNQKSKSIFIGKR